MDLTLAQILDATNGELLQGSVKAPVARLCTDTRILQDGDLFVALRGPNFNGEEFVDAALAAGACGAVVSHTYTPGEAVPEGRCLVRVDDAVEALGAIARAWRRVVAPRIAAITGSCGKTTTKEMAAHICRGPLRLLATEGNRNNHIGLPLTLLRLEPGHEAAIVEVGMNHAGELTALARIAEPEIGCVTMVGDAHIGNFPEGQSGVIAAKAELIEAMNPLGAAVLNADCENSAVLRRHYKMPRTVVTFGAHPSADVRVLRPRRVEPFGYAFDLRLFGETAPVTLALFGRYQVHNALAAATIASLLGVSLERIVAALVTFRAPGMRSEVTLVAGVHLIEDCYNASPAAMVQSIQSFSEVVPGGRRYLLLGDMHELGAVTEERHRLVGQAAARSGADGVACVGERARWIADEAMREHPGVVHLDGVEEAAEWLAARLRPGDALLVKGSRLARLERAVQRLRALLLGDTAEVAP